MNYIYSIQIARSLMELSWVIFIKVYMNAIELNEKKNVEIY